MVGLLVSYCLAMNFYLQQPSPLEQRIFCSDLLEDIAIYLPRAKCQRYREMDTMKTADTDTFQVHEEQKRI